MRWWTKLLPFWFVAWYARRFLPRINVGDWTYVEAYSGDDCTLIRVKQ